jgi:hypothetical protein
MGCKTILKARQVVNGHLSVSPKRLSLDNFYGMNFFGLDHPFGHVLGRGGFHIRPEQGRYGICPYSLDQTMIKAK